VTDRGDSSVSSFVTSRPVAILMLFIAAVLFGFFSYRRLPVNLMPELTYPTLTVRTEYPGAAPEEVENDISRPVEEALGVIGGLRKISSVSRAEVSDVILEFAWDVDVSDATQDVLERLDLVFLPDEARRPLILHFDPALDPIMELSLAGEGVAFEGEPGLRRLRRLADLQIKRVLEPIKGVAAVRVKGGLEEEIQVLLDEDQLQRSGLSIEEVISRLREENINVAGGTIQEGRTEYLVRTLNEYEDLDQIRDTIVKRYENRDLRIKDIATVVRAHKDRQIITRTDGHESVQIEIYKEADANIVAVAKRVKAVVGRLKLDASNAVVETGPSRGRRGGARGLAQQLFEEEGARLGVVADRSLFIESSIREVRNTAIYGGLLAVLVLFLFLREFRTTLIIAASIPVSLLVTFAPLHLLGVSLNIMSLGGLALGIGMLVDSSIVVLESIHRCREEGDALVSAAIRGTSEVRAAVAASTFTSIAVFFPMVFVEGVAGQAFGDLGMAVVVSLLASLVVALYLIPMLASRKVRFEARSAWSKWPGWSWARDRIVTWSLRRKLLLGLTLVPLAVGVIPLAAYGAVVLVWRMLRGYGLTVWHAFRRVPWWVNLFVLPLVAWLLAPIVRVIVRLTGPFHSLRVFARDVRSAPRWVLFVVLPLLYWLVRLVVGLLLEILGKLVLLAFMALTALLTLVLLPPVRLLVRGVAWIPLWLTQVTLRWVQESLYPSVLRWALRNPLVVVLLVAATLAGTWSMARRLDSELLPEVKQGEFTVEVALPVGTPLEETDAILSPVEDAILREKENIRALIVTLGYDPTQSERSDEGEHTARFKVLLEPAGRRGPEYEEQVVERIRRRFEGIPDLKSSITRPVLFSSKTPIEVEVHGDDLTLLKRYADQVQAVMTAMPELADVTSTLRSGAPEIEVVYDRERLTRYGLNIATVARLVRDKVQGFEATRFNLHDRRIPIVVRLDESDRETVEDVSELIVNPGGDRPIKLASVADVVVGEGPSEVRRIDARRVAVVRANIATGSLGSAVASIERELRSKVDWPSDMSFYISGQNEEWERSRGSLILALGLSVFLVYVIMAIQFESLIHPLVIMFTIPLAFIGSVAVLDLLHIPLSVLVFLGMIMLAGIVVNNAIVLVDYVNQLRRRGMPRDEALLVAGKVRLRPILMTTATTVLGLTPMAFGLGDGAEIRTPMAITVISGLISSTVLTLLIIPTIYRIADLLVARLAPAADESTAAPGSPQAAPGRTSP
jgi:HAE1 family hydrophobic/amphiphilic exporter-1